MNEFTFINVTGWCYYYTYLMNCHTQLQGHGALKFLTPTGPRWACQSRGFIVILVGKSEQGHAVPAYQVPTSDTTQQNTKPAMQSFSTILAMATSRTAQLQALAKTRTSLVASQTPRSSHK